MIDAFLNRTGLTKKDFNITFAIKKQKYRVKTFTPLWWICSALCIGAISMFLIIILMCLSFLVPAVPLGGVT